jgi:hypothetical protein
VSRNTRARVGDSLGKKMATPRLSTR